MSTLICEEPLQITQIVVPKRREIARRIPELDGLRGIAIAMVLVAHLFLQTDWGAWESGAAVGKTALSFCRGGVDVFFVLSGFLIGRILLAAQSTAISHTRTILSFYVNRAFRILPLYWMLLGSFAAALAFEIHTRAGLASRLFWTIPLWEYATFLQSYAMAAKQTVGAQWLAVTWSLGIEEQFYLIAPLMICFFSRKGLVTICAISLVACPILRFVLSEHNPFAVFAPYCRIDSICMGILVAVMAQGGVAMEWVRERGKWLTIATAAITLLGIIATPLTSDRTWTIAFPTIYALTTSLVICGLVTRTHSRPTRALTWPALTFFGGISYFVYLFHLPFQYVTHLTYRNIYGDYNTPTMLAVILAGLFLTLCAGCLSRNIFERPLIKLGHTLSSRLLP